MFINLCSLAAHCLYEKNKPKKLNRDVQVIVGIFDLDDPLEGGRQILNCEEIFIHPNWNPLVKKFDADVAIIQTEVDISFNKYVTPICLWDSRNLVPNGIVVGYGQSENKSREYEPIPTKIEVSIVDYQQCVIEDFSFIELATPKTFCAGSRDGQRGTCTGDSGSGLIFKHQNKFYSLGIVSSSFKNDQQLCDITKNTVYTKVYDYKDWIENPTNEDHSKVRDELRACKNGQKIPFYLMCDGNFDCVDKSDEERCGELKGLKN